MRLITVIVSLVVLSFSASLEARPKKVVHHPKGIKDAYIVILEPSAVGVDSVASDLVKRHGGSPHTFFRHALNGFAIRMNAAQAEAMLKDSRVMLVEQDAILSVSTTQPVGSTQYNLDRIDQRPTLNYSQPNTGSYTYCETGVGVKAYVVDTGVAYWHSELLNASGGIRVTTGIDFVSGDPLAGDGVANDPCPFPTDGRMLEYEKTCDSQWALNGSHGTAVASVIAGRTLGVAKDITIVPVRVFDCYGTSYTSRTLWGLDWIAYDHQAGTPAVANLSFEGLFSVADDSAFYWAINQLADDGVVVVAAAGNYNNDACAVLPARIARAITVGASNHFDERWISGPTSGSGYGPCVDVFAPGVEVPSAHMWECQYYVAATSSPYALRPSSLTGTSFSAPLVSGAVAKYLQAHPTATPDQVAAWVVSNATSGAMVSSTLGPGSPNKLLYSACE